MVVGMIGLGRMGLNMSRRLLDHGLEVVGYNRTPARSGVLAEAGGTAVSSLEDLVRALPAPRVVWLMLPAGTAVDEHLTRLSHLLSSGDAIIDGANGHYRDAMRRAEVLGPAGLSLLDVGVSGGVWGREAGYCLMIGGSREVYQSLAPLWTALAPEDGHRYCGPAGAGHFLKMIHNGIEYGLMQAYAEGFALLEASPYGGSDLAGVARLWNRGSVIRSWLLELTEKALARDPGLATLKAYVDDSGEGRWAVQSAVEMGIPVPVLTAALQERFRSRLDNSWADRLLAALRREFGGHSVITDQGDGQREVAEQITNNGFASKKEDCR